jgi:hypothetical protein
MSGQLPQLDALKASVGKVFDEIGAQNVTRRILLQRLALEYNMDFQPHRALVDRIAMTIFKSPDLIPAPLDPRDPPLVDYHLLNAELRTTDQQHMPGIHQFANAHDDSGGLLMPELHRRMHAMACTLRAKRHWWRDVFDETIIATWRLEAMAQGFTSPAFDLIVDELWPAPVVGERRVGGGWRCAGARACRARGAAGRTAGGAARIAGGHRLPPGQQRAGAQPL